MQKVNSVSVTALLNGNHSGFRFSLKRIITSNKVLWIGSPILLLIIWETVARLDIVAPYILPAPTAIAKASIDLLVSGELLTHTLASLKRAIPAFLAGSFTGIILGLMMGWSKIINNLADIPFNIFRAIPKVALVPIFMVWFGLGEFPKVLVLLLSPLVKLTINTQAGVRSVDTTYVKAARALGAKDKDILREVVIPSILPMIFAGLRLSIVVCLMMLVMVEMVAANSGIGYLIKNSEEFLQTDKMFVGVMVLSLLGLACDGCIRLLENKLLVWQKGKTVAARS